MTKTLFISGGSRGIGEAVVRLAAGKYNVAFTYFKNEERARNIAAELDGKYGGVMCVYCDVRDEKSVLTAIECAKKRFGKIDILINNAGAECSGLLIDITAKEWRECFAVNVDGVFNLTKAVMGDMLSRKSGSVVNVSSVWGIYGASNEAKAAVIGFTKALAKEVAPSGVRVNAVAPGAIDTDMMKSYSQEEIKALCTDGIPLGRLGAPAEAAEAILFAAGNTYMTGGVLGIDGLLR